MEKHTTASPVEASPTWERLEMRLRSQMREWLQAALEAEVDELLGRRKSARRKPVDGVPGYRTVYGKRTPAPARRSAAAGGEKRH